MLARPAASLLRIAVLYIMAFLILPLTIAHAQSALFPGPRNYMVGGSPTAVVIGDFNGDGRPDIATANGGATPNVYSNDISVLLQNADGTFQPAVSYAAGTNPVSMHAGDFNNDGKLDLAVLNLTDLTLSIFLGNGDGTFQAQKVTQLPTGNAIDGTFAVGDFNHDGKLDIAVQIETAQVNTYAVLVLTGKGDGTFQVGNSYAIPYRGPIQSADMNNDGKLDLVVCTSNTNQILVLLGNGDGTFQPALSTPDSQADNGTFVIADFNHDGKLDIVVSGGSATTPSAYLYLGNGDGTFQSGTALPSSSNGAAVPLVAADLNGDGIPDLILAGQGQGLLQVYLNQGNGSFTVGSTIPILSASTYVPSGIAAGDLGGDGKMDLVAANYNADGSLGLPEVVTVLMGNGDGTFLSVPGYAAPGSALMASDFNNDGKPDLAVASYFANPGNGFASQLSLLLNLGSSFGAATVTKNTNGPYAVAADLRGNGISDVVIGTSTQQPNGIGVLLGNGDGTLQPEVFYGATMSGPVAMGDFNNDGKLDIVGLNGPNQIGVLLGKGDGTFGFPVTSTFSTNYAFVNFTVGDFNGDGKLDLVVIEELDRLLLVLLGNGDGTFALAPTTYPLLANNTNAIASGDVNGDGKPDLVVAYPLRQTSNSNPTFLPGAVAVSLGNGDGTFRSPTLIDAGLAPSCVALADFNLDGKLDVAISSPAWNETAVLLGNGDGTLQPPMEYATGGACLAVADFAGKGSADLAVTGGGNVAVLYNQLSGPAAVLSKTAVNFGNQGTGYTSAPLTVNLSNSGTETLSVSNVSLTGPQASDYSIIANTCSSGITSGSSCQVTLTFAPQALGSRFATLRFVDNAFNSPQVVTLTGTGAAPAAAATLSPSSVNFGNQPVGSASSTQTLTVSSSGTIPLSISGIAVAGAQASDFTIVSNNCGATLVNGTTCAVGLQFSPTASGSLAANLTVTDNAAGSPQLVALSGTGVTPSIGLGVASGGSSSATVTAGAGANYMLSIGGSGVSGTINLACTGAPAGSTCTVPASENVSGTKATTFTVTVSTTAPTSGAMRRPGRFEPWLWATVVLASLLGMRKGESSAPKRRVLWMLSTLVLLLSLMVGCGGSSGSTSSGGTPPGTYTLTVTGTGASATQSLPLTLTVK